MPRWARVLAPFLFVGGALAAPSEVHANYTEAHLGGADVRVTIGRDGHFSVAHKLTYRVLAGAMRSLTIQGFDQDLRFAPTGTATTADGRSFGLALLRDDKGLHVAVDDPKGLKRGDYTFEIDYEASLTGPGVAGRLVLEGAFYRLRFATPPMGEGLDGMRVVLDLPSAPTEPRAASSPDEGDSSELPTLRRGAERDELELVRPHVAKGQAVTWSARIDPKALPAIDDPALRVHVEAPSSLPVAPRSELPAILAAAAALLLFALALAKQRLLLEQDARMQGLVPLPAAVRATLASCAFGAGVYVQSLSRPLLAAALVALALPLVAWRTALDIRAPRRSGGWLVLRPDEAFARAPVAADWLDATTPRGRVVLVALSIATALLAYLARRIEGASYWIGIDALVLVPLLFSGTSSQAPPSLRRAAAALAPIAERLESRQDIRVVPYARPDELRLLVVPRIAMPGVIGIEIGVAWERAGGAMLHTYEALVRVQDASFAAAKMAAYTQQRNLPGRKPEERVYRFEPKGPSMDAVVTLARELAETLHDRRLVVVAPAAWEGDDRRAPPNVRCPAPAMAFAMPGGRS